MWLFKEMWYHRKNHYISIIAISVAMFLVMTVSVISDGFIMEITEEINGLGTDVTVIETLGKDDGHWFYELVEEKDIDCASVCYEKSFDDYEIIFCDSSMDSLLNLKFIKGEFFSQMDVLYNNNVAVLSHSVYEQLGYKGVGSTISIDGISYEVCGVLSEDNENLYIDMSKAVFIPEGYSTGAERNLYFLKNKGSYLEGSLGRYFNEDEYVLIDQSQVIEATTKILKLSKNVLMFLAYIAVFVALMGNINNMLSTVKDRTYEIGLKKALGATSKQIYLQFLLEGLTIMLISSLISFAGCLLMSSIFNGFNIIHVSLKSCGNIVFKMIILGIICCLYPCYKGSKVTVISALRRNEA